MSNRKKVSLLITDLDNTLYDWLSPWHVAFDEMIRTLINLTNVDRGTLEKEIRKVHTAQGSSECIIHSGQLPCIQQEFLSTEVRGRVTNALESYHTGFHGAKLIAYPTVLSTLRSIHRTGATMVAYTEALGCYAANRIQRLRLDGELDYLYVPHGSSQYASDLSGPATPTNRPILATTTLVETREGLKKPNPQVLQQISDELGEKAEHVAYVGDGLLKDVKMAQDARVTDVYAEYGMDRESPQYQQLRRVSHWPESDVDHERTTDHSKSNEVIPTHSIQAFSDLLLLFDFTTHRVS